jgi:hypothetical protein
MGDWRWPAQDTTVGGHVYRVLCLSPVVPVPIRCQVPVPLFDDSVEVA